MMKINEIVQTDGWKKFMAKLYGWGAAVVLMGALFKIQHWPGASIMLILGMGTEVVIFFFSAFEPLPEEIDWTLVYPELAGIEEEEGEASGEGSGETSKATKKSVSGGESAGGGSPMPEMTGLKKLEAMMQSVEVNADMFSTLGDGLNKLNQTTNNLTDITDATIATDQYASQVRTAAESVGTLTETFERTKDDLHQSISGLSDAYRSSAEMIQQSGSDVAEKFNRSGDDLLNTYQELSESIKGGADHISTGAQEYSGKIEAMNKNLAALNSIYELQTQETNNHIESSKEVFKGFDQMMKNLKEAAGSTEDYRDKVNDLSKNIEELNSVYGNMLSSLNTIS